MKYENEEQIRKDFARLFDWYDIDSSYAYANSKRTLKTPEWAEIFCKVGKLIVASKIANYELMEKENE